MQRATVRAVDTPHGSPAHSPQPAAASSSQQQPAAVSRMGDEEEEARKFLESFAEEFPATLEEDRPLPVSPLSRRVSLEELHGETLEVGLKLLAARYCSFHRERGENNRLDESARLTQRE